MKVFIKSKDGIIMPVRINVWNLEKLKAKHGDNLTVPASERLMIRIERFTCIKCRVQLPIIENYNKNLCFKCKYGVKNESCKRAV